MHAHKKNIQISYLGWGFLILVMLMMLIVGVGVFGLKRLSQDLDAIVSGTSQHSNLAKQMRLASRERAVLLGKIMLMEDAFARDDLIMVFTDWGHSFGKARRQLLALSLKPADKALLEEQGKITARVLPLQLKLIDQVIDGNLAEASRMLLANVSPLQDELIGALNSFVDLKEAETVAIMQAAKRAQVRVTQALLLGGLVAVLMGTAVAFRVTRRMGGLVTLLERREREARVLLENIPDLVWFKDGDARYQWVNPAFGRLTGVTSDQVGALCDAAVWQAEQTAQAHSDDHQAIAAKQTIFTEKVLNDKENPRRFAISLTPIFDAVDQCVGVLGLARDITEQRQMEQQIKAALQELESQKFAMDQHAIVSIADVAGQITYVNEKFCAVSGYRREQLLGQNHYLLKSGKHSAAFYRDMWASLFSGQVWHGEICNRNQNGQHYWVDATIVPFLDAAGLTYQYVSISSEITTQKAIEAALQRESNEKTVEVREREALVSAISTAAHDAMVVIDDAGKIAYWNQAAERLFGYSIEAALEQDFHQLVIPPIYAEQQKLGFAHFLQGDEGAMIGRTTEVRARRKNGSEFTLELSLSALRMKGRWHGVGIGRDVTERQQAAAEMVRQNEELIELNEKLKDAQHQLLQSEKMASVGQLAAGVAHEINNPIGYVHSNLGTLEDYTQDLLQLVQAYEAEERAITEAAVLERLRVAKKKAGIEFLRTDMGALMNETRDGISRVKKIVQDLKDFSRIDATDEWHWADLHKGLDSTLNIIWNELKYKAEVRKEYAAIPEVECRPSQLNQVFMNLLVNAGHAIADKGLITIRTGQEGKQVWVAIEDSGQGIATEHLTHIFDPFFTTKPIGQGTGLGLSLSYSIVQNHGGRIEVQSTLGQGSIFKVWLPIHQSAAMNAAAAYS